jgi:predicted nucleotidyltransferase
MLRPTPYPDVNALLAVLLAEVQTVLKEQFAGLYLYGSLAVGDFNVHSDVDFVVATTDTLPDETVSALAAMHDRIAAGGMAWTTELEGSYIPLAALRRYDRAAAVHPHLDRGIGERLAVVQHDSDWVIQRYSLREYGIMVAGPPVQTLIDPISPAELRRAVLDIVQEWWTPMLEDPVQLRHDGYHTYAILTMCRILYTLQHGTIVSKLAAARWAQGWLHERPAALVKRALDWKISQDDLPETLALMRQVAARCREG